MGYNGNRDRNNTFDDDFYNYVSTNLSMTRPLGQRNLQSHLQSGKPSFPSIPPMIALRSNPPNAPAIWPAAYRTEIRIANSFLVYHELKR